MGISLSRFRRDHQSPPRPQPQPQSSPPVPSVSIPPPPPRPALPPPPESSPPQPLAQTTPPAPPPPPAAYPYPSPATFSGPPRAAPYYQYPPPTYAPYAPQPPVGAYSYPAPYPCQPPAVPPPHYSQFAGYYNNRWFSPPAAAAGPSAAAPPPYVDHKAAKKIKNDVNVHKDSIKLSSDEQNPGYHLVSFTFDALVDGSITVFYFAKEGEKCIFAPIYPEIYSPQRIPFQKGLGQKFCQPSGSGIDLGFFDNDELSNPSQNEEVFPLVIFAETSTPSLIDAQPDQSVSSTSTHAQITEAVLVKGNEENFQVKVIKQILWVEGVRYELREIYGISNTDDKGFEDDDPGKECVICMTNPKDTAILPCRHMCLCGECAKELRLKSNKCPICRQPIEELLEIKVNNASTS